MKTRIDSIDYNGSIADGPGIRTILFLQGCNQRCDGCHNPSTWDMDKGDLVDVEIVTREVITEVVTR